jgi:murein L,D-transpeptidase YcbB/YkuD
MRMLLLTAIAMFALALSMAAGPSMAAAPKFSANAGEILYDRLSSGRYNLNRPKKVIRFYRERNYRPIWHDGQSLLPGARAFIDLILNSTAEGLNPSCYGLSALGDFEDATPTRPESFADLDVLLTDTFFSYAAHLYSGRIDPRSVYKKWSIATKSDNLMKDLNRALDTKGFRAALDGLAPRHPGYLKLRRALNAYREVEAGGGWPEIPEGPDLRRGKRGKRVVLLRERLSATGDLETEEQRAIFDNAMDKALRRFQKRHGLGEDGVVGTETLKARNVPVGQRIRQMGLNMERWRWLPEGFGLRHIVVNITNFQLTVFDSGYPVLNMRVVVGRPDWDTPAINARMTRLVLNPMWHIPRSIAVKEMLPAIKRDPEYLTRRGIEVLHGDMSEPVVIEASDINWSVVTAGNFDFFLRQESGPRNPLGSIKFILPNPFGVYLHDTPSWRLFEKNNRAFSHSCIRIEKPLQLAEYLLDSDPVWDMAAIRYAISDGNRRTIELPEPIDIHLIYWTCWVDQDGTVNFRNDIYGHDALLDRAISSLGCQP